jgi:hypothetical protein
LSVSVQSTNPIQITSVEEADFDYVVTVIAVNVKCEKLIERLKDLIY